MMLQSNKWKTIKNFNKYQINKCGDIMIKKSGLIMKQRFKQSGYKIINLINKDGYKTFHVHRLVLSTFKHRKNIKCLQVNHKDGDKSNNYLENLEWCSQNQNFKHAKKLGLIKNGFELEHTKLSISEGQYILKLLRNTNISQTLVAEKYNISQSTVSLIYNKKFRWSVLE